MNIVDISTIEITNELKLNFIELYQSYFREILGEDYETFKKNNSDLLKWLDSFNEKDFVHKKYLILTEDESIDGFFAFRIEKQNEDRFQVIPQDSYISIHKRRMGMGTKCWNAMINYCKDTIKQEFEVIVSTGLVGTREFFATLGLTYLQQRVDQKFLLKELNIEKLQSQNDEFQNITDFSLLKFQNCPEEIIEQFCILYKKIKSFAASTNYLGEYELTPELRRNYEKQYGIDSGNDWRTIVIKNSGDELIGLTEVYVVNNGTIAFQELTGILPQYRRKGLARWIKNQMLIDIKQVYPDLQEIFTRNYIGNTNSGEAVLAMNQSIGYNPIKYDYQYKTRYIID